MVVRLLSYSQAEVLTKYTPRTFFQFCPVSVLFRSSFEPWYLPFFKSIFSSVEKEKKLYVRIKLGEVYYLHMTACYLCPWAALKRTSDLNSACSVDSAAISDPSEVKRQDSSYFPGPEEARLLSGRYQRQRQSFRRFYSSAVRCPCELIIFRKFVLGSRLVQA